MDKFSVSAAKLFKGCQRQYYHEVVCGWTPINKPSWLAKGSAYDKLMENWDNVGYAAALKAIPELFPNPYDAVDAEFILNLYNEKYADIPMRPVAFNGSNGTQLGYGVEFKGNELTGPVEMKVTGYLDKLTSTEGEVEVVERKTTSDEIEYKRKAKDSASIEETSAFWDKWSMDSQTRGYVWYLRSVGAPHPGWVTVEAIRKPSKTVNKVFDKTVSIAAYRAAVLTHVEKKTLITRHRFYVSDDMSQEFIIDHANTFQDIQACKARQVKVEVAGYSGEYAWVRNEDSCGNYGGCAHRDICEGKCTHESSGKFCKSEKYLKQRGVN